MGAADLVEAVDRSSYATVEELMSATKQIETELDARYPTAHADAEKISAGLRECGISAG